MCELEASGVELMEPNQSVRIKFTVFDVIIIVINPQSASPFVFFLAPPPTSPAARLVSRFVKRNYSAMSAVPLQPPR